MTPEAAVASASRRPVRAVGPREHYLGVAILSLVMLLCTWILVRGLAPKGVLWGAYDPSLFALGTGAPQATEALAAETAPAVTASAETRSPGPATPPPAGAALTILPVSGGDWQAQAPQSFGPDNLYEKIDGRAEAYLAYGFERLECATYSKGADSVDLFIYDMATPLQAFGMYTSERGEGRPLGLGQQGYDTEGSLFFWQQRYYVQLVSANGSAAERTFAARLAPQVAAKLPQGEAEIPGLKWFPAQGLVADSVAYTREAALGQDWLKDVYTARFTEGGVEVEAFLARRDEAGQATELLTRYKEFLAGAGKLTAGQAGGTTLHICDQNGMYDIVFQKGSTFGGVTYVEDRAAAEKVAARLAEGQP